MTPIRSAIQRGESAGRRVGDPKYMNPEPWTLYNNITVQYSGTENERKLEAVLSLINDPLVPFRVQLSSVIWWSYHHLNWSRFVAFPPVSQRTFSCHFGCRVCVSIFRLWDLFFHHLFRFERKTALVSFLLMLQLWLLPFCLKSVVYLLLQRSRCCCRCCRSGFFLRMISCEK